MRAVVEIETLRAPEDHPGARFAFGRFFSRKGIPMTRMNESTARAGSPQAPAGRAGRLWLHVWLAVLAWAGLASVTVHAQAAPAITTGSPLAPGAVGDAYAQTFMASGGATPYAWEISSGSAPTGLSMSGGGLLSGTPATTGSFGFTVEVTGSDGQFSTTPFSMMVLPPPMISSTLSATGTNEAAFSYQITATNSPASYGASGLPAGLGVNAATGLISGTLTETGMSNATITASNVAGTGSAALSITVVQMPAPVLNAPFAMLHAFSSGDGANPVAGLAEGTDGNLHGTTEFGGPDDDGTVFEMTTSGSLSTLFSFDFTNGYAPIGGLVQGMNGNFYGMTEVGGSHDYGTVFEVATSGSFTILYSFAHTDGGYPTDGLVTGSDGNFYGTTAIGGAEGDGTVFEMSESGSLSTLFSFNYTNGYSPTAGLVQGSDGNLYGTTEEGGSSGDGTIFKVTTSGSLTSLVSFDGTNGLEPVAGLAQGSDGNFYGTTYYGGAGDEGTVYSMTTSGSLTTLCSFIGTNGANPVAGLIQGLDGNFYGTTFGGGAGGSGTVFAVTASGSLTTLCVFTGTNGANPEAGLIQGSNGTFYGTTYNGGSGGDGTVFSLTPFSVVATLGAPFSYQISATSNVPPTYAAANLPAGLSVNTATGLISGTATATGTSSATISAINLGGTGSAILTITVAPAAPVIGGALSATGTSGLAFSYPITATNNPASYNATGLPAGLSVNTATGLISGTATATGTSDVTITAANAGGTGMAALTIVMETSFAAWENFWFTSAQLANPAISGTNATPASDGIPNLSKYALNLDPLVDGAPGLPVGSMITVGGSNYLTLTYTQVILATDITYVPEVSGDLQTWNSGPLYVAPVSVTANPGGLTETVVVRDLTPATSGAARFMRLEITSP